MDLGAPPVLPVMRLPEPLNLPRPVLEVPRADLPSYKPIVVPPSDLRPPPGVTGTTPSEQEPRKEPPKPKPKPVKPSTSPEIRYWEVPILDKEIPVPSAEILSTAATTATVSVAATLTATAIFKQLVSVMKPVIKKILTKKKKNAES